ncbi:TonB-dependent receptor [Algoriphagus vanfongensis]|uniref:TonB-dependent receptor n=1 Tax=Algoriphagus vanfongensis TaxID=426371 RepID=UPI00047AD6FC|nr:TonB-dependent receptor [Algoriphagus vanfongensis]
MRQILPSIILGMLFLFVGIGIAEAQVTTSSLQGQVVDAQGEALPGANVVATHEPSGTRYGAVSNLEGRFNLPNLRIGGPYTVQVSFIGFQTQSYSGIVLRLGEPYGLSVTLSDDSTELSEVVITGSKSSEFDSNRTGTSTNVSNEQLANLPQVNRSVTEFTRLTPQASGNSFAGRDARYNNFQVDGANFNNGFGLSSNPLPGGNSQPISLDAIEEISVNIAPFDVTQSGFTGAGINAVTRSGTNTFQGSAYYFMKNQGLQGKKIGDNELEAVDAATNNFGFRLGGPIIKNKLFFFANFEREENTGGNASGVNLWRPSTDGVADPENNIARTTVSDLEAVRNHLINVWGYDPGRYEGYASEAKDYSNKILARIDWNISNKHKLAVRYNQVVGTSNQVANGSSGPRPRSGTNRVSQNSITFENGNYGFENSVRSITAELNSYFSSSVSNQFLATYSKIQDRRTTPSSQLFPFVDIWDGDPNGNNYMSFGTELFSYNNDVVNDNFSFINNLTYVQGKHTFTAGAAFEVQKFGNSYVRMGTSYYRYLTVEDFLTTGTPEEVAPIMFGLTYPYEGQETYARVNFGLASLYFQDRYQASDKLALTLGVRAELPIYMNDLTPNPSINALTFQDVDGNPKNYDSGAWPKSRLMVSPRFGFNYDVNGDRSFVLRGGTGVFSGRVPFVWLTNMPTGAGVLQNNVEPGNYEQIADWIGNVTFQPEQYYYVENPPAGAEDVFIKNPEEGAPGSFALVDDEFKMPMVWRSSLGAELAIPNTPLLLTTDLLYTKDINGVFQFGANRATSPNTMNAAGDDREVVLDSDDITYNPALGANNATVLTNTSLKGNAFSATVGLSVLDVKGLTGSVYYTYSTAKEVSANAGSNASSAWGASPNINNPNDQRLWLSNYAIPHRVMANLSYKIEYGKLATTVGVYYNGSHQGRFSYTFSNDYNGDGVNADLIYLPENSAELNFVDIVSDGNVVFTAEEQRQAFDTFVSENGLDEYRGDYLPRNGFLEPWLNRFDVRVLQDVFTNIGENKNTLQLSLDIVNFGNLLNSDWGIQNSMNNAQNLLTRSGSVTTAPNVIMNRVSNQLPTTPFQNASGFGTTWSMQFGIRYIFN